MVTQLYKDIEFIPEYKILLKNILKGQNNV